MATMQSIASRRQLFTPMVVIAAVVTLAGCGSSSSPSTGAATGKITYDRLMQAIASTRQIPSAHVALNFTIHTQFGGEHGTVAGDANFPANSGSSSAKIGGVEEHSVLRSGTTWLMLNAPQFTSILPAGKTWVEASTTELEQLGAVHPLIESLAILDAMRGIQKIHQAGPGKATFTFSLPQAIARTPPSRRAALQRAIHANGGTFTETGAVTVSGDGTVRFERLTIHGTGSQAGIHVQSTMLLSNVGERVQPTPPPASEVVPLTQLPTLRRLLQRAGRST